MWSSRKQDRRTCIGVAAMMLGCDEASRQGMVVSNIKNLILKNVHVTGCDGEEIIADNVDAIVKE